jgi:hypothetical protein
METTTTKDQDSNLISSQPANPPQLSDSTAQIPSGTALQDQILKTQSKILQDTDTQATELLTIVSLIATVLWLFAGGWLFWEFLQSHQWTDRKNATTGKNERDCSIWGVIAPPLIPWVVLVANCKDLVEMTSASAIQLAISQSVLLISTFVFALALCCHRLSKEKEGLLSSMARAASNCCHTLGNILWIRLRVPIWISLLCSIWSIVILSRKQSYV